MEGYWATFFFVGDKEDFDPIEFVATTVAGARKPTDVSGCKQQRWTLMAVATGQQAAGGNYPHAQYSINRRGQHTGPMVRRKAHEGRLILGGERELLMCPLTRGDKYQLLKQLPRRATYIKECLKAHWKVGYKLDENERYDHDGMGAENIWHSHRFHITCIRRIRWYMVNVLVVTQVSDIMN